MLKTRPLRFLIGIAFSLSGMAQGVSPAAGKQAPPRVFIHTRAESMDRAFINSWKEGDTTYLLDTRTGKAFTFFGENLKEMKHHPPAPMEGWNGQMKFRRGAWWFLQLERGVRPMDKVSSLFRYDVTTKSWSPLHQFDVRASNFEIMDEDRILLFGIYSPSKAGYFMAGTVSASSPAVSLLDEVPIKHHFQDLFWKACITTIDNQMAYAYFPLSGHVFGYDLISHSLREFRVPWSLISDESIEKTIEAAKTAGKKDCYIAAVGHPGASNCYFLPLPGGQMAFIYKVLDEEEEKQFTFSDGKRPLVERVGAIMLVPDDPRMLMELTPPSQKALERLCWSTSAGRLVRWEDLVAPEKKPPMKTAPKVR